MPDTFAPTHVGAVDGQSPLAWQRKTPAQLVVQYVTTFTSTDAVGGHVGWTVEFGAQQNWPEQSEPRVQDQHVVPLQFEEHIVW